MSRGAAPLRRGLPAETSSVRAQPDKRFRRPEARPARRRWRKVAWRAGLAGLAGLVALGALVLAGKAVLNSRLLAVRQLVVRGNTRLSTGEVEALLDGVRGQNIFLVDLEDCRKRLMGSPWVAEATIGRVLPATVSVRIVERAPMVVARLGPHLYLMDGEGMIIDEFGPQYREFDLPIVDGLVRAPGAAGPRVDLPGVQAAGRFLDALRARPDLRRRVSQLDVADPRDLVVLLDEDPALLHLGDARFLQRLEMYLDIAPTLRDQMKDIDSVDLRLDDLAHVIVRSKAGQR